MEATSQQMRLNYDVLFLVMAAMQRKADILACMLTCRTLYDGGMQFLLRLPLYFPINNTIVPFCEFILRQFPHRSRYLRELTLGHPGDEYWSYVEPSTIRLLARVLSGAQDLHTLTLHNINRLFISDSTLSDSLSCIKGITELNVLWPSVPLFRALNKMDVPVARLNIDFYAYNRQPIDPLPKIAPFKTTVKDLSLSFVTFVRNRDPEKDVICPRVRTLSIKRSSLTPLGPLIHAFPNVHRLTVLMSHHPNVLLDPDAQASREANQTTQICQSWPQLNYVQGDILSLYLLGLSSMVYHVDVVDLTTPVLHLLPTVLLDMRPTRLSLAITTRKCDLTHFPELLGQVLRQLQLTHLFVTLDLSYSYPDVEDILRDFCKSIAALTAPNFKLTIHWKPPTHIGITTMRPSLQVHTEIYLKLLNPRDLAKRMMQSSDSIRDICLEFWLHPVSFWRVIPSKKTDDLEESPSVERVRDGSGWKLFYEEHT